MAAILLISVAICTTILSAVRKLPVPDTRAAVLLALRVSVAMGLAYGLSFGWGQWSVTIARVAVFAIGLLVATILLQQYGTRRGGPGRGRAV